jgi:3',5'-cyclic AMP phosphodiesterase CpdA
MWTATSSPPPLASSTGGSATPAEAPTLLAQLTDLHIEVGPGDGAAARATAAAVSAVRALSPAPHAVLVTGDVAESGAAREYERARELLAPLGLPVHVLPGNHDDHDALAAHLGWEGVHGYAVKVGRIRVIALDSTRPGFDDGGLPTERLEWLASELAADLTPTVLAMHHPPLLTGIESLDRLGIAAAERVALRSVIAASPHVLRVVAGHVHRAAFGTLGSCGVVAAPAAHLEARLEIGGTILDLEEASPGFALHVTLRDACTTHVQTVTTAA